MSMVSRPPPVYGGVLADDMGLGKTLSSLALVCHSLDTANYGVLTSDRTRATLIIGTKSTIHNWESQIKLHIKSGAVSYLLYVGANRHKLSAISSSDIVLTTYETLLADVSKGDKFVNLEWARIILDEAHRIRNAKSKIFRCVCALNATYRWCLTGTPMQNSLDDFGALLSFLRIPPFRDTKSFTQYVLQSMAKIQSGRHRLDDYIADDFKLLRGIVAATCLRRTKKMISSGIVLPPLLQHVEMLDLDQSGRVLYNFFKRFSFMAANSNTRKSPLSLISTMRLICDHGEALLSAESFSAWKNRDRGNLALQALTEVGIERCAGCGRDIQDLDTFEAVLNEFSCNHAFCQSCSKNMVDSVAADQSRPLDESQPIAVIAGSGQACLLCGAGLSGPDMSRNYNSISSNSETPSISPSAKLRAILHNVRKENLDETVNKHYWTGMLDLIQAALTREGVPLCRIDGQSSFDQRKQVLDDFAAENGSLRVLLASISAAGEGIDLTAANIVHLVEPHWNPMAEAQAIDRVHRVGQTRDVNVIRYIAKDSVETYVQWIQDQKLQMIQHTMSSFDSDPAKQVGERFEKLLTYLES